VVVEARTLAAPAIFKWTVAPATGAPDASITLPVMRPLACPNSVAEKAAKMQRTRLKFTD
jgi:hypothetical protein